MIGQYSSYLDALTSVPQSQLKKLDYSNSPSLTESESANKSLRRLLIKFYRTNEGKIHTLILRTRAVSGAAIMGLVEGDKLYRLKNELRVIDFSKTNASENALACLGDFLHLEEAYFNDCPKVDLTRFNGHKNLSVLSLVGSKVSLVCIKEDILSLPKLKELSYSVNLSDQLPIGLKNCRRLVHPKITVPCGHINASNDKHSCGNQNERNIFLSKLAVRILKKGLEWSVQLLDINRNPIKSAENLFLHESCKEIYSQKPEFNESCVQCQEPISEENIHQIRLDLDSSLEPIQDFEYLPVSAIYDIVRRGVENQNRSGFY